jgi:hypothetical protein
MKEFKTEKKSEVSQTRARAKAAPEKRVEYAFPKDYLTGGFQPPEKFAPVISELSHSANGSQRASVISQLQQTYGNKYVQRVISASRSKNVGEDESKLASEILSQKGAGRTLETKARESMESRFARNFSNVRIHTDSFAVKSAQALEARAFAVGNDVFFGGGEYNPRSFEGKELIAHELTHVVQYASNGAFRIRRAAEEREAPEDEEAERFVGPTVYVWFPDEAKFQSDYNRAFNYAQTYIDLAQSTTSAMIIAYLAAEREATRIMALKDPESIWKTIAFLALSIAIRAIPGAGIIADRLKSIKDNGGGYFAKGLEETIKVVGSYLAARAIMFNPSPPKVSAEPGVLGELKRANEIVQHEIQVKNDLFEAWQNGWDNCKENPLLPYWDYDLYEKVKGRFEPSVALSANDFQPEFEKMLVKQAITERVQAGSGTRVFGGETVYHFYRPTLSRESLKEIVKRYGWDLWQIVSWSRGWFPPYAPWNWYEIEKGEEP